VKKIPYFNKMPLFESQRLGGGGGGLASVFDLSRLLQAAIIGLAIAVVSVVFVHRGTSYKAIGVTALCAGATVLIFGAWYPEGMAGFHQGVGLAAGAQMIGF